MLADNTIKPGELFWGEVRKSKKCEDTGVEIGEQDGKLWVTCVKDKGLFRKWTPLEEGDQLLAVNDRNVDGLSAAEVNSIFQKEKHVKVKAVRAQFGLYDSSSVNCTVEQSESSEYE